MELVPSVFLIMHSFLLAFPRTSQDRLFAWASVEPSTLALSLAIIFSGLRAQYDASSRALRQGLRDELGLLGDRLTTPRRSIILTLQFSRGTAGGGER